MGNLSPEGKRENVESDNPHQKYSTQIGGRSAEGCFRNAGWYYVRLYPWRHQDCLHSRLHDVTEALASFNDPTKGHGQHSRRNMSRFTTRSRQQDKYGNGAAIE